MINGIDLLFVVIGFVLLLIFVEGWNRYKNWSEWDRNRRRQRQNYRHEFKESFVEEEYRSYLRTLISPGLISAMYKMNYTFNKLNQALRGN